MTPEPCTAVLSGLGGYGNVYLDALLDDPQQRVRLVGAVDPAPRSGARLSELSVPLYSRLEDFFASATADLTIIAAPIHEHCPQTCLALSMGSTVLCEKPAAATVQDVDRMRAAQEAAGRLVAVGFQWSFSRGIQELKRDLLAGRFGKPRRARSLCLWPRDAAYYERNDWAGRYRDARGNWILDGPINNAMAHDLHNLLYLLGPAADASAEPRQLAAELYRAKPIETCDTAALRVRTASGVEILFLASHATREVHDPIFEIECSEATIRFAGGDGPIVAGTLSYESPNSEPHAGKVWTTLDAAAGRCNLPCGLRAARAHTLCVNGAHEAVPEAAAFPLEATSAEGDLTWVPGLAEIMRECYATCRLPSETGASWARPAGEVSLEEYRRYPRNA